MILGDFFDSVPEEFFREAFDADLQRPDIRGRSATAGLKPALLIGAQDAQRRIEASGAVLHDGGPAALGRRARLVRAILTIVEHVELHEPAECQAMVEAADTAGVFVTGLTL